MRVLRGFLVFFAALRHAEAAFMTPTTTTTQTNRASSVHHARLSTTAVKANLLENLPNPFQRPNFPAFETTTTSGGDDDSGGLVGRAKRVLQSDFGLTDPSLLADGDDEFQWIGCYVDTALSKTDYIAAGRFFDLRAAFPDLDYRAHDFRLVNDNTVRFTCRVTGTMRGELRLRSGVLPPTGVTMRCPPTAVTMEFDDANNNNAKVTKLVTGFCMDRLVGNTDGGTGVVAASKIAGDDSVSNFELLPPVTVLSRVLARPVKPIPETTTFLAPFPETVMIQLAKGVISSDMAAQDPTLLADDFTYCTPTIGPIRKKEFLVKYAASELAGYNPNFSNFRIDPYDPVRVWVDLDPTDAASNYRGHPQAMSFTFDDDGFCTRLTTSAVMDPTVGNAGGLGGPEGYKYAVGQASNPLFTRPLPRFLGRVRKRVLSPFTGVGVDEYSAPGRKKSTATAAAAAVVKATPPPMPPVPPKAPPAVPSMSIKPQTTPAERLRRAAAPSPSKQVAPPPKTDSAIEKQLENLKDFAGSIRIPTVPLAPPPSKPKDVEADKVKAGAEKKKAAVAKQREAENKKLQARTTAAAAAEAKKRESAAAAEAKKREAEAKKRKAEEARAAAATAAESRKREAAAAAEAKKREAEAKKKEVEEARAAAAAAAEARKREAAAAAEAKKQQAAAAAEAKKREAEEKRAAAEARKREAAAAAEAKRRQAEELRAEEARKQREEKERKDAAAKARLAEVAGRVAEKKETQPKGEQPKALGGLAEAASRATISLFGLGKKELEDLPEPTAKKTTKKAPLGVPTLSRWRKNRDNTITGLVSGSRGFKDGERITTSAIATGKLESGELVQTGSGSRYFLD